MLNSLEDVILFASLAHKNQKMIEPEVPYLTHLIGVASNVLEAYYNGREQFDLDYALKLALLHDVIEDTEYTYEDIKERFGEKIANGVLKLTKNESLKYEEQIKEALTRIVKGEKEVQIVKLADRTYNMKSSPLSWNDKKKVQYLIDAKLIYTTLKSSSEYLANKLKDRIDNYNR